MARKIKYLLYAESLPAPLLHLRNPFLSSLSFAILVTRNVAGLLGLSPYPPVMQNGSSQLLLRRLIREKLYMVAKKKI